MYSFAKKLKKPLLSVLGLTLVAVLTVAGTLAYLQDESEEIVNTFKANGVTVTLTETTGETYDIIPGTTVKKDPTVTVDNTLDAFVFVEITGDTSPQIAGPSLVDYEIADGWNVLTDKEDYKLLWREVKAKDEVKKFSVLKDDQVTFSADLENDDMTLSGDRLRKVTLAFKATAIQKEPFNTADNAWKQIPAEVANGTDFKNAIAEGKPVTLTKDITLSSSYATIKKDAVIDLNGHKLSGRAMNGNTIALLIENPDPNQEIHVTIKGGTLEAPYYPRGKVGTTALWVKGKSTVTVENCTLTTRNNQAMTVLTNGSESLDSTIVIKNSIISAPTATGSKGYAAYLPAGNVTFENCNVTGHIFISGGSANLIGGTYTATGFNNQSKLYDVAGTVDFVKGWTGGNAYNMGDAILIAARRGGYQPTNVTIKDITFNTNIPGLGTAYAIKYVDLNESGAEARENIVVENVKFNDKLADGTDPVMYIDKAGNDISNELFPAP